MYDTGYAAGSLPGIGVKDRSGESKIRVTSDEELIKVRRIVKYN